MAPEQALAAQDDPSSSNEFGRDADAFCVESMDNHDTGDAPNDTWEVEDREMLEGNWWPSAEQLQQIEIPVGCLYIL